MIEAHHDIEQQCYDEPGDQKADHQEFVVKCAELFKDGRRRRLHAKLPRPRLRRHSGNGGRRSGEHRKRRQAQRPPGAHRFIDNSIARAAKPTKPYTKARATTTE